MFSHILKKIQHKQYERRGRRRRWTWEARGGGAKRMWKLSYGCRLLGYSAMNERWLGYSSHETTKAEILSSKSHLFPNF